MTFSSSKNPMFKNVFSETIFEHKYEHEGAATWADLASLVVEDVCEDWLTKDEKGELIQLITNLKFIPGGRYLYYAGRDNKFFNNCYLLRSLEDSREDWANLSRKSELCLSTGGGIGNDYSRYRHAGSIIHKTGGVASGPLAKMQMINELGRCIMQGGSRRSAIYASLNWQHQDIPEFLKIKNWHNMPVAGTDKTVADLKRYNFNYQAPLDMTNVSVNYDTQWLLDLWEGSDGGIVFNENVKQAITTGEPGFSFNFFDKENETLRNACTEVTSEDDSDVCNLGSINLAVIDTISEFKTTIELATKFLICGSRKAKLPYEKIYHVREKNRRLGLGLMGFHEWLIQRGSHYEVTPELHRWLHAYKAVSDYTSRAFADQLSVSRPVANRAIAPTGTIGILAGTTTGIEPIFAVAYKRRYLKGTRWHYQYVIDATADRLIQEGVNPDDIESAIDLTTNPERRIKFQADVQDYVDMGISSTINLPANIGDDVSTFSNLITKYCHRLRGLTFYPDGSRGGQPLVSIPYADTVKKLGKEYEEAVEIHDICELSDRGGTCSS